MTPKDFAKLVARDGGGCLCCGEMEAISPNHRANRGMGGAKNTSPLNLPSNYLVLCSRMNYLIEADADQAARAINYGWKVSRYMDPRTIPVYDAKNGKWYTLDDQYGRHEVRGNSVKFSGDLPGSPTV